MVPPVAAPFCPFFWNHELWYRVQHLYDSKMDRLEPVRRPSGKSGYGKLRPVFRLGLQPLLFQISERKTGR